MLGQLTVLAVVKAKDQLRWRSSLVHQRVDAPAEVVRAVVAEMVAGGFRVEYHELGHEVPGEDFRFVPGLAYRRSDGDRVNAELHQLWQPPPTGFRHESWP